MGWNAPLVVVSLIFAGSLVGFFFTKTAGWGPYTTSILLLVLVLFIAAIAFAMGNIEWPSMSNLLLAIAGFAGGLVSKKTDDK